MNRLSTGFFALAVAAFAGGASAQETASPPAEGWTTQCVTASRGPRPDCSAVQQVILTESRQLVASVTVTVPGETPRPNILFRIPIGLYIPFGLKIDVDGSEVQTYELQTCDQTGCYASSLLSDAMLNTLRRGGTLGLSFQNLNRETMRIPVPLAGFAAAFDRIR
ncbi:MAG TPA: invasion associated locus B family protein [Sphingomonadales bacterium]|nr:invasion associated locus B family protein [Sphingomonadales bacterium]